MGAVPDNLVSFSATRFYAGFAKKAFTICFKNKVQRPVSHCYPDHDSGIALVSALAELTKMLPFSKLGFEKFQKAEEEYNKQVSIVSR
jgi:hypothetical protein